MSPGSRACSHPHLKLPDCFPPSMAASTSVDEAVCTWQPCLRPGYHLHAVSSLYVVVACGPLTLLAMYSHNSSDRGHPGYPHLKGLWSWPPPWTPYHPWAVMGSLCEHEHEQMGQRMQLWTREGARLGWGACARYKRYWKGAQAWASGLRESSISCSEVCFVSSLFSLHFIFTNILFRYYGRQPSSHLNSAYFDYHPPTFQPNSTSFQPCHTENDPLHHPLLQQWMAGVQMWTVQEAWVWGVPIQTERAWGVNVDSSRGMGVRDANTDWESMGCECGWFKGCGHKGCQHRLREHVAWMWMVQGAWV